MRTPMRTPHHATPQVGKQVFDAAPRQMRVELWKSALQRRGVGVAAAKSYPDLLQMEASCGPGLLCFAACALPCGSGRVDMPFQTLQRVFQQNQTHYLFVTTAHQVPDEAATDIEKDLSRTFPATRRFAGPEGQGALGRVLRAYAALDPVRRGGAAGVFRVVYA
jgi:hypothetical protein